MNVATTQPASPIDAVHRTVADPLAAAACRTMPRGDVTFMFTDLEGSTRLLQALGAAAYRAALERHYVLLREPVERGGGLEMGMIGDAMFAVFADPAAALRACADIQRAFATEAWPASARFAVRIGLHRGPATPYRDTYVALAVHAAARVAAAAHGGQVVVSDAVRRAASPAPEGLRLVSLGEHMLKDFDDPVELHQLAGHGLERHFPALRTPRNRRPRRVIAARRRSRGLGSASCRQPARS